MRIKLTIIAIIATIFIAPSFADNAKTTTSKGYVDTQIATKQDKVPAVDTNTVITTTNTTGEIGQKSIYDANGNYATQTDALVTAADANAAVQNAIDTEFVCVEWAPNTTETPENCYIWKIQNVSSQLVLPTGYTALEYLESTGTQYITTTIPWTSVTRFRGKAQQHFSNVQVNLALIGSSTLHNSYGSFWGTAFWGSEGGIREWYWNTRINPTTIANFDIHRSGDVDWTGIVNGVTTSTLTATRPQSAGYWNFIGNVIIMGTNVSDHTRNFNGKVWYIQLFDNSGVQIFSGVPARRNSDNVVGMYDTVTNTFLTNAGTGEFIAGPDLNNYLPSGN